MLPFTNVTDGLKLEHFYQTMTLPNLSFYRIKRGIYRIFVTVQHAYSDGSACLYRRLTPPNTWFRPIDTCICSTCQGQYFTQICLDFSDFALRIFQSTSIEHCNGCGMPTEDANSSGHLALCHLGLAFVLILRPF